MNKPEEIRSVPWGWIEATMAWVGSLPLGGPRPGNQGGIGGLEIEFNHVVNDLINHAYILKPQ